MAKKPPKKEYTGSVYIGVVGPEGENGAARDSINAIARRSVDSPISFLRATKGYEARQQHINTFLNTHHDFILFLDSDQTFPVETLELLRRHKLPYVSGFYMRRNIQILLPVWYRPSRGKWPMEPWVGTVERGKLHPLGASGWGCILAHRDVIMGVRALLKGEWEVLEDDMDIWPYDLARIMVAINGLDKLVSTDNLHPVAVRAFVEELKEEIRPLRADREMVGSDIRFPYFAMHAGYQLYGDPDVACGHMANYPISITDYEVLSEEKLIAANKEQRKFVRSERRRIEGQRKELLNE